MDTVEYPPPGFASVCLDSVLPAQKKSTHCLIHPRPVRVFRHTCRVLRARAGDVSNAESYVDDLNQPTEAYPFNPNGSPEGIAGLCSEDGRHLAVMPHPERCFLTWQVWYYI